MPTPSHCGAQHCGSGFASTKLFGAAAMATAIGCLMSTNTPWAVPGAQIWGAHPRASSNLNMSTTRVAQEKWCRKGPTLLFHPASPHLGHPGLKRCPLALTLPILAPIPLSVYPCLSPAPVCLTLCSSLSHTYKHVHACCYKRTSFIRVHLARSSTGRHLQTPASAGPCPWGQSQGSPCRKLPDWKTVILQAPGKLGR